LILKRFLSLLLAIHILNFSIDSQDAAPDHIAEDLSLNDIESFYEFFLEDIVGIQNAVEERDERDQDDGGSFESKKFYFSSVVSSVQSKPTDYIYELHVPKHNCPELAIRYSEIESPPPRA